MYLIPGSGTAKWTMVMVSDINYTCAFHAMTCWFVPLFSVAWCTVYCEYLLNQTHCSSLDCGNVHTVSACMDMSVTAAVDTWDTAHLGKHGQLFVTLQTFWVFFCFCLVWSRELVCCCLLFVFLYIHKSSKYIFWLSTKGVTGFNQCSSKCF